MTARVAMLAMHRDGVIALPPPRGRRNPPRPIVFGPDTEPPLFPAPTALDEVRPLEMRPVVRETREAGCGTSSSPATTTSDTRTWSAPRCATPSRPNGWLHRHARLLHRRLEARSARQVHRMDAWRRPREEPPPGRRQPAVPDPALIEILNLGSHILAIVRRRLPGTGPSATTSRRCSSKLWHRTATHIAEQWSPG